jgi:hypothetical protein
MQSSPSKPSFQTIHRLIIEPFLPHSRSVTAESPPVRVVRPEIIFAFPLFRPTMKACEVKGQLHSQSERQVQDMFISKSQKVSHTYIFPCVAVSAL